MPTSSFSLKTRSSAIVKYAVVQESVRSSLIHVPTDIGIQTDLYGKAAAACLLCGRYRSTSLSNLGNYLYKQSLLQLYHDTVDYYIAQ